MLPDPEPRIPDPGSRIPDPGSRIPDGQIVAPTGSTGWWATPKRAIMAIDASESARRWRSGADRPPTSDDVPAAAGPRRWTGRHTGAVAWMGRPARSQPRADRG